MSDLEGQSSWSWFEAAHLKLSVLSASLLIFDFDGIDGGQKDYSNSGGVSRLCMYSSAAHISLR